MWRLICGSNGAISSRYEEQLGRYAEQWPKSLLRMQTTLVAIRSSQPLIHTSHWSLCAHLSRYLPSGAAYALLGGSLFRYFCGGSSWT